MTTEHWNVQVNIQRVIKHDIPARGMQGPSSERETTEVLKLAVTADSEAEAFRKASRILTANAPEPVEHLHLHRASCDDSGGNLVCGFPPGRTIAG